ncbi:hypothetical protein HYZ99_03855 [Candidatus Peregrinibacteria bacterium]|nr:hypothetical protein [Candidatus Peregrinibacteria bacterium]
MSDTQINSLDPQKRSSPLWKQMAGALGGAAIAFALYSAYQAAEPTLTAWVSLPRASMDEEPTAEVEVPDTASPETQERIAARARAIAERFSERPVHAAAPEEEDVMHSMVEEEEPMEAPEPIVEEPQPEATVEEAPAPIVEEPVAEVMEKASYAEVMAEPPRAPSLPSSGVGLWIAAAFSILGALGWKHRARLQRMTSL